MPGGVTVLPSPSCSPSAEEAGAGPLPQRRSQAGVEALEVGPPTQPWDLISEKVPRMLRDVSPFREGLERGD